MGADGWNLEKTVFFYNWMETRTFRAGCVDFTGILKDKIAAFVLIPDDNV